MLLNRSSPTRIALAILLLLSTLVGTSIWAERNGGGAFLPHGFCFTWIPSLLWLQVLSDALIGLAYFSIPIGLWRFARKRTDLPFHRIFLMFGPFIVACGATHWLGIWNVWVPDYWLSGTVKAITAAVSVPTAVALFVLIPRALSLPTTEQLKHANEALQKEIELRRAAEAQLLEAQRILERRVEERTRALGEMTARAQAANQAKDEFISMLSHELRNPMTPLANAHAILKRTQPLNETGQAALHMAMRQAKQLRRLVDDLLDTTRITQRRITLQPEPVDVGSIVEHAVQTIAPLVLQRGQPLSVSISATGGRIVADPARLHQVVENLLSNAVKFTSDRDLIRVEVAGDDDGVTIVVADEGVGIDAAHLPRVFDLFVQADTTIDRSPGGLGIGLAWVKTIVEMHGGTASAASEGRHRGARFTIRLPREQRRRPSDGTRVDSVDTGRGIA